jgi:hypothetical protein
MKMINTSIVENIIESKFLSSQKFSLDIENYVIENSCTYIDAIISYCEDNDIELDSISKILSKPLKEKLKVEAEKLNLLKRVSKTKTKSVI